MRFTRKVERVILYVTILAALCASLLAVALYKRSRHYERFFHTTRLDPLGLNIFDDIDNTMVDPHTQRIVFFGDSRTAEWPDPNLSNTYRIFNRGIHGHTSTQALLRFDMHIAPLQPDLVILQAGINDLAAIPALPAMRAEIIAECKHNIAEIVEKSRAIGARVIVTTIFPPAQPGLLSYGPAQNMKIATDEVNAFIATLVAEDVTILDAAAILSDDSGFTATEYHQDLLHLNQQGYARLNQALQELPEFRQ